MKMVSLIVGLIIVCLIIIVWKIFDKKNKYDIDSNAYMSFILSENAKEYKNLPKINHPSAEYIDIGPLFDSCGKDFTHSAKLLRDLYGSNVNDKIVI